MKLAAVLLLALIASPAAASPVHVALKATAVVSPNADGFFSLGAVADVTGGESALRARLAGITIGRAPLSGETRRLTLGDLALKIRQAGCDPGKVAVLEGAETAQVTSQQSGPGIAALSPGARRSGTESNLPATGSPVPAALPPLSSPTPAVPGPPLVHRGDAVTIVIQSGPLTINAPGTAREGGSEGQAIRVHREGVMTDLIVHVIDAQTVRLEI